MPYSVPPLFMLQDILDVTRGEIPVFIDCRIESGIDVYKCLALGAKAVSVGRHLMPLLKNGIDETAGRIKEMTGELAAIMAVCMIQKIIDRAEPKNTKFSIESMPWMIPSSPDEYLRLMLPLILPQQPEHVRL